MPKLDDSIINEIRAKADLVEVISHYIPVQKKGKGYMAVCPFHDDHDPSMSISADKQIYKCFVCGSGGNVFGFVKNYENISFIEAVGKVAKLSGVPLEFDLSPYEKPINAQHSAMYKVYDMANEFLTYQIKQESTILAYLHSRHIPDELIQYFNIGYNGNHDVLVHYLRAKKINDSLLLDTNLASMGAEGLHDVFKNRITIPIHDRNGHLIAYTARITPQWEGPKYINTSSTELYVKSDVLFNFHRVKALGNQLKQVYVVEGAMDVIGLAKAKIFNAVATLGTSVTKKQLQLLKHFGVDIVLFYDGDKAGQAATYRFGTMAIEEGLPFTIVHNPTQLDPDEYGMQNGMEALQALSQKTISWIDFLFEFLKTKYNLNNYADQKKYALEIHSQIMLLQEKFEKQRYLKKLTLFTGFELEVTQTQSNANSSTPKAYKQPKRMLHRKRGIELAQETLVAQMLKSRQASALFSSELGFMVDPLYNQLAMYVVEYYVHNAHIEIADFLNFVSDEQTANLLLSIEQDEVSNQPYNEVVVMESIWKIQEHMLEHKIEELKEEVKTNPGLFEQLITLQRERAKVNNGKNR
ncbi:MAG: DNA primase [Erysipelotrichaceae bacterium]